MEEIKHFPEKIYIFLQQNTRSKLSLKRLNSLNKLGLRLAKLSPGCELVK